jgi:hypothetical protein
MKLYLKERGHLEDLVLDGRVIFEWFSAGDLETGLTGLMTVNRLMNLTFQCKAMDLLTS